ncbi:hypothetical protein Hsar01_01973 [Haloferula sargassicola]|uniref:SbsA Ig-like domain-containing protein n=2 Tax=Haloferula sargassicola TaxID=490096 RepID=A0ABP9UMG1_9BACT
MPLVLQPVPAQVTSPKVDSVSSTEVAISFTAPPGTPLANLALESNPDLSATNWNVEAGASFSLVGGSAFSVTVPRPTGPAGERRFYRILLDGEVIVTFDTDDFAEGGTAGFPVTFDAPFTGSVPYSILRSDGSTLEGTLNLTHATSAVIPFSVADDDAVSGGRFVTLSVSPEAGSSFTRSYDISDNDQLWDGVFTDSDGGELTFVLEDIVQAGGRSLRLVNRDGASFFPAGAGPLVSSGTFDDSSISVTIGSATRLGDENAFGFPSYYELTLDGLVRSGSDGRYFEGENLGDAVLVHHVGRINPAVDPPTDRLDAEAGNDSLPSATDLGALSPAEPTIALNGLSINGDPDFYRFTSPGGATVNIRIEFAHADGDLDMTRYDGGGTSVEFSNGTADHEQFTFVSAGGTSTIQVYGFSGARNAYRLMISTEALPPPTSGAHLGTTVDGRFAIIKRPLPPADGKAALITPAH